MLRLAVPERRVPPRVDKELADAMRCTRARTKREAVVTAMQDFNRRKRMAELVRHACTCERLNGVDEVQDLRRKS